MKHTKSLLVLCVTCLMGYMLVSCAQVSNSTTVMLSFDAQTLARDIIVHNDPTNPDPNAESIQYLVVSLRGNNYSSGKVASIAFEDLIDGASVPVSFNDVPFGETVYAVANLYNFEGEWNCTGKSNPVTIDSEDKTISLEINSIDVDFYQVGRVKSVSSFQSYDGNTQWGSSTPEITLYFFDTNLYCMKSDENEISWGTWEESLDVLTDNDCMLHLTEYSCMEVSGLDASYNIIYSDTKLIAPPRTQTVHYTNTEGRVTLSFKSSNSVIYRTKDDATLYIPS